MCVDIIRFPELCSPLAEIWTQGDYEWACETGWMSFQAECKDPSPFQDSETEWVSHNHQSSLCCFWTEQW